mmetsp:Transcript_42879/g.104838  ORF Transcript_42879/g.104838 Transcript_42879/m.104838 type:complete len:204 (+) Transcript_42879:761-1372(+)
MAHQTKQPRGHVMHTTRSSCQQLPPTTRNQPMRRLRSSSRFPPSLHRQSPSSHLSGGHQLAPPMPPTEGRGRETPSHPPSAACRPQTPRPSRRRPLPTAATGRLPGRTRRCGLAGSRLWRRRFIARVLPCSLPLSPSSPRRPGRLVGCLTLAALSTSLVSPLSSSESSRIMWTRLSGRRGWQWRGRMQGHMRTGLCCCQGSTG